MSMRGHARSAGAQKTQRRNRGQALPTQRASLAEVTQ